MESETMRLLWLCPYVPLRIFGGGTRVFNLIRVLAPRCTIDLIASGDHPAEDDPMVRQLRALCRRVEIVPPTVTSRRNRRLRQLRALVSRHPAQYWTFFSPRMQERIDRALREERYDAIILEHSFMGYYTIAAGQTPVVLDQHNVESEVLRRASRNERSVLRRAFNLLEWVKYRVDEQRACLAAATILATSEPDRATMQAWGALPPCAVIPNGVDTAYFTPAENTETTEQPPHVTFTGSMHYAPNAEAMLYFVGEIWPLVQQRVPQATLSIVGGAPPSEIMRLGERPNVRVISAVPDMRQHLARAQVVVAPLRIGGGTRLKILEAMAMERAVVSTSLGCEGLDVQAGHHLLVADDPGEFATRVVELMGDPARRAALGRAGRHLVEERYDWQSIGLRLEGLLREFRTRTAAPESCGVERNVLRVHERTRDQKETSA